MTAVNAQTWDPSVKALTQFPSVLSNMAQNLSWTSQLGEDYHNQQADVMTAIQTLRAKAKSAGNLKTRLPDHGRAAVAAGHRDPADKSASRLRSQYNPAIVYGYPYVVPAYVYFLLPAPPMWSLPASSAFGAGNRCRSNDVQQLGI